MNEVLMDAAYSAARENSKAAEMATFKALDNQFPSAGFDSLHRASRRALRLHVAAYDLAEKVWAQSLAMEKASEILSQQFPEFPKPTCDRALNEACVDAR